MKNNKAYIALGGNIGDTTNYIKSAYMKMEEYGLHVLKKSSIIKTKPFGPVEQDDFLNAVCLVETDKSPIELLKLLLKIEKEFGRIRNIHWGPRTIDLDLIYYNHEIIENDNLIIPHPGISERDFVLIPLSEISPEFIHPINKKTNLEMLQQLELKEMLEWLDARARFGIRLGLETTRKILSFFDNPQNKIKCIHVAGTNGKGSTCAYLATVLEKANYSVGLFTSPFIEDFSERFQINHKNISNADLFSTLKRVKDVVDKLDKEGYCPTHFEILTVMAFIYFYEKKVDYAVIEVGLGGLYDSTNVIDNPLAVVLTAIDYDHMNVLGNTLKEIAKQKCGIIKKDSLIFSMFQMSEAKEEIIQTAENNNCKLEFLNKDDILIKRSDINGLDFKYLDFNNVSLSMIGDHQSSNASLAILVLLRLRDLNLVKFRDEELLLGLFKTRLVARLEKLQDLPILMLDGAHNIHGAKALRKSLDKFKYNNLILGLGILKDKAYMDIVKELVPIASSVIITKSPYASRALDSSELKKCVSKYCNNVYIEDDLYKALKLSLEKASNYDLVLWSGSLYLVGEIRKIYKNNISEFNIID